MNGEDNEKGDFVIEAIGSSSLIERDMQDSSVGEVVQMSLNPIFGIDPKKAAAELLKTRKLNLKLFEYDDDEWQQIVEQMSAPPPDSSLQIAEMRLQSEQAKAEHTGELKSMEMQNNNANLERDRIAKAANDEFDKIFAKDLSIDQIKAELAKTMMTLQVQVDLNDTEVATPIVEPAGRAPDGEAFEK